jgi:hypothetical protein
MYKKKIVFLSNHADFFCSHRINLFLEAKKRGFDFYLIIGDGSSKIMEANALKKLKLLKIKFIQYSFNANYNFVKKFGFLSFNF